jgi:hypothetical protein
MLFTDTKQTLRHAATCMHLPWALCAAVSVLSSKCLLLDIGFHYPYHLHLLQLSTVLIARLLQLVLTPPKLRRTLSTSASTRALQSTILHAGIMAASSICIGQAILHFRNLPTVVMLSVRIYPVQREDDGEMDN